jgi:hypothetical protein
MNFNLGSKNNMGAIATIILIILLSQSKFFNFLIDTALGRVFLVAFILAISSINKVLGVIIVLFIMIIFNQSSIGYMEGYTAMTKTDVDVSKEEKKTKENNGREGFNMIDRESTIQKGKRSNEVPIFTNARNQTDDVEPTDKGSFKDSPSTF